MTVGENREGRQKGKESAISEVREGEKENGEEEDCASLARPIKGERPVGPTWTRGPVEARPATSGPVRPDWAEFSFCVIHPLPAQSTHRNLRRSPLDGAKPWTPTGTVEGR